jgi:hypothetical protein
MWMRISTVFIFVILGEFDQTGMPAAERLICAGTSKRASHYSRQGVVVAALAPPVRPVASAVWIAGSRFVSVATALTEGSRAGLDVSSTTAVSGLLG